MAAIVLPIRLTKPKCAEITARMAFGAALVMTLVMALLPHPPKLAIDGLGDKFEHSLAFVALTGLAWMSFPRARLSRIGERLSFLGALIEVLQAIPSLHRDCDIFDWLTDTAAIVVVLVIIGACRRHRRAQKIGIARAKVERAVPSASAGCSDACGIGRSTDWPS